MQSIPIFVISLARALGRRQAISKHLKNLGLSFEIIDGIDGKELSEQERSDLLGAGIDLHPGIIGCYLSHLKVYEIIRDQRIPAALILEDDAVLLPEIRPLIQEGLNTTDFDYLYLDCDNKNQQGLVFYDRRNKIEPYEGFSAFATHAGPPGLHAYIMTLDSATKRLAAAFPIMVDVDVYTFLPYQPKFYAMVNRRGAGVSDLSRRSYTSKRDELETNTSFRLLRNSRIYPKVADLFKLGPFIRGKALRDAKQSGLLPAGGDWHALPPGRAVRYE